MPKLKSMRARELVRALLKLGFVEHRQQATSHLIMKHIDGRRTTVPIHSKGDIPKGTLSAILRDIDVTKEELAKNL